jgi:ubiquinone/menaquinone biosynthesis C-methylase UbiE
MSYDFSRVAEIYDATRGLPHGISELVAESIVHGVHATPATRFLELGVGTGRIALPLARLGHSYTGVDISEEMMNRLREKAAAEGLNITVQNADITTLPFPDASFDVVVAVHILHLVPEWRKALAEARRVTSPDGYFVLAGNLRAPDDPAGEVRRRWYDIAHEESTTVRPENGSPAAVEAELIAQGCYLAVYRAAQWETMVSPAELLEQQRRRMFSYSWTMSDEELARVDERVTAWATERYEDLSVPLPSREEFHVRVTRWPR